MQKLFSCRIPCFGLSALCLSRSLIPSVCSTYRPKFWRPHFFPLVFVLRHLHHRLFCEWVSAQYLRVLVMCWPPATRGMEVALLQVTPPRNNGLRVPHVDSDYSLVVKLLRARAIFSWAPTIASSPAKQAFYCSFRRYSGDSCLIRS
jgi:hypothetical protein